MEGEERVVLGELVRQMSEWEFQAGELKERMKDVDDRLKRLEKAMDGIADVFGRVVPY